MELELETFSKIRDDSNVNGKSVSAGSELI